MSLITEHKALAGDFHLITIEQENQAEPGQFYMLRGWQHYPVLSRPISVYDATPNTLTFLYKVFGEGTELISRLKVGDDLIAQGPYGKGFHIKPGKIAMVGGGVGIAPLYYTAKEIKKQHPQSEIDFFLGFSGSPILEEEYQNVGDHCLVNVGGYVTDFIDTTQYDYIYTCGPDIMMKVLYQRYLDQGSSAKMYVSLENRMACGIGICLVCTCKTTKGNRVTCKHGPVFLAEEVFGDVHA